MRYACLILLLLVSVLPGWADSKEESFFVQPHSYTVLDFKTDKTVVLPAINKATAGDVAFSTYGTGDQIEVRVRALGPAPSGASLDVGMNSYEARVTVPKTASFLHAYDIPVSPKVKNPLLVRTADGRVYKVHVSGVIPDAAGKWVRVLIKWAPLP